MWRSWDQLLSWPEMNKALTLTEVIVKNVQMDQQEWDYLNGPSRVSCQYQYSLLIGKMVVRIKLICLAQMVKGANKPKSCDQLSAIVGQKYQSQSWLWCFQDCKISIITYFNINVVTLNSLQEAGFRRNTNMEVRHHWHQGFQSNTSPLCPFSQLG